MPIEGGGKVITAFCWFFGITGYQKVNPGVAYVNLDAVNLATNTVLPFDRLPAGRMQARIIAGASGNEAGNGKGVRINTAGGPLCEIVWNGAATWRAIGAWTNVTLTTDLEVGIEVKASSATEDITLYYVVLEIAYAP